MYFIKIITFIILLKLCIFADDTIKIVYNSDTPPLKFTDTNNTANGMIIDIWRLWAKKNNHKIEFIESSWADTLEMIKDGRADIHAGLYYIKKRDKFLDYTSKPLYTNKKYFFYYKSIKNIYKIDDFLPYVIAVDNGYAITYLKDNYPELYRKEFKSANSANKTFFDGEVKVVLSSLPTFYYYLRKHNIDESLYNYNKNTYAFSKKYYGAVKKGNKELLNIIEKGFKDISEKQIKDIELKWTKNFNFKTLNNTLKEVSFTKEELDYLHNKKEIKMCVDPSWLPFENIEKGKYTGMVADIYKIFKYHLNVPINLVETKTWSESLTLAKVRKCDILSAAVKTQYREKFLDFTKPYMSFPEVLVTREKEPFIVKFEDIVDKKIGVVKDYAISTLIKAHYPQINLVETKDVLDGLFKVSSGELFGFIDTTATVNYAIENNGMTNLKIATTVGLDYKIRVGTRNDETLLVDIFNKVINKTDRDSIDSIKDNWLKVKVQKLIDYTLVYKILAWFLVVFLVIIYWNRKLKQEINERTKAQKELNKFSQIIEQSDVSIMLTNLNGEIIYVNPYCINESGYTQNELLGNKPNIFKSGYQDEKFYNNLWTTINLGLTWTGEFSNKKKNGDIYWESATIAPIFDEDKNIKFFVSIKQNITERIKVQKKLQIAQKEANKANESKSDFLAKMSHEIRTPMNAVLGMLYLLEKTHLKESQKNYIKKANIAANTLLGIINDILDFSKIEANKLEIKNSEFSIFELVSDIMSIMSVKAEDNSLELLTQFDEDIPVYIISDRLRLAQVLNNLISNAIKFTQAGEVLVSVSLVTKGLEEDTLKFCVKDSGVGISQDNQEKLFQEFMQVDDSATRSFHGTGLGLAICKKLVNLLGGDIWIESSTIGVGTTICFTTKVKITTKKEHLGFIFPTSTTNLKVLVADDNRLASEVLTDMLESFKYIVDNTSNGYETIKMVQENKYDIVFLDYKMPKLSGLETFIKYKEILQDKTPKTVIVTAYSTEIIQEDIEKYGIYGYLLKPISPSTLYDKIMEILYPNKTIIKVENQNNNKVLQSVNVLLVEDNELNREFATLILEGFGLKVDIAVDGVEAIEKIITKKYKLVLMDIQMPKLDGLSATKKIRSLKEDYFKTLPIIALSANALVSDKEKSLEVGMNEHLNKPIDPNKLYIVLKKFILEKDIEGKEIKEKDNFKYISNLNPEIFDIEEAINRVSGNEFVYIKILQQFANNYKNLLSYIEKLLRNNEHELLEKKIHELKGISGNIAAKKLYRVLSLINAKLINKTILDMELIEEFKSSFKEVISEIEKIDFVNMNEEKKFDKKKVVELLKNLKSNLNLDIVLCEEIFEELSTYLQKDYNEFYLELSDTLNSFDMDKTEELIENFLEELNNAK